MKLSAREDIEAPIDYVLDKVSDFALLERSGMRRGVEVVRKEAEGRTSWDLAFSFRGRPRKALVTLEKVEAPNSLGFVPLAIAAFIRRAPSMWTASPRSFAWR